MNFVRHRTPWNGNSSLPKMGFLLFILALTITVLPRLRPALEARLPTVPLTGVPEENPLLAERREPSGLDQPESSRSTATFEIEKLFRDSPSENILPEQPEMPEQPEHGEDIALDGQMRDLLSLVVDNSVRMSKREMPAYWELVRKTSRASFQKLHESANTKIKFNDLYGNPAQHRGELIALDIVVRRVTRCDVVPENNADANGVYEIWGSTDQSHAWLYVFITEALPDGFNEESILKKRIQFAGYFLKLLAYQPGSASPNATPLLAPLLIGRLDTVQQATPISTNSLPWWATWGLSSFIILTAAFLSLRVFLSVGQSRKTVEAPRSIGKEFDSMWDEADGNVPSPPSNDGKA